MNANSGVKSLIINSVNSLVDYEFYRSLCEWCDKEPIDFMLDDEWRDDYTTMYQVYWLVCSQICDRKPYDVLDKRWIYDFVAISGEPMAMPA